LIIAQHYLIILQTAELPYAIIMLLQTLWVPQITSTPATIATILFRLPDIE
jgi:hypothetical protein